MKNRKAWIWLILAALMLSLWGCGNQPEPGKHPEFQMPKVLSTVSVKDGAPGQTLYASTEAFSLYIDETAATFSVTDTAGNRWSSVPEGITNPETLRYAWTMNPEVNTVNGQGYPLLPAEIKLKK